MTDSSILRLANRLFNTASVRSMEPVQKALNRGAAASCPGVPGSLNWKCRPHHSTSRTVPGLPSIVELSVESAGRDQLCSATTRIGFDGHTHIDTPSTPYGAIASHSPQIKPLRVRDPGGETTRSAPTLIPLRHRHPLRRQELRRQLPRRLISARRRATQPAMVDLSEADSAYNLLFAPSTALL